MTSRVKRSSAGTKAVGASAIDLIPRRSQRSVEPAMNTTSARPKFSRTTGISAAAVVPTPAVVSAKPNERLVADEEGDGMWTREYREDHWASLA